MKFKITFTDVEKEKLEYYEKESRKYIDKAILLGWRQESKENRVKYL